MNISITNFYENFLKAPFHNHRWSWGSVDSKGRVFLRVWQDETKGNSVVIGFPPTGIGYYPKIDISSQPGYVERKKHINRILNGAPFFLTMCEANDPATKGKIKSFDKDIFVGGDTFYDSDGYLFATWSSRKKYPDFIKDYT